MLLYSITDREKEAILDNLNPQDIMLEYGSGGSTLLFSKYVQSYNSVEHDKDWYEKIKPLVSENTTLVHANCYYKNNNVHCDYNSEEERDKWRSYYEGVKLLKKNYYNKVFIDGRARAYCALEVIKYIDDQSLVFIHDYVGRAYYHNLVEQKYDRVDLIDSLVILKLKTK